jgi:hypothetical protein
MAATMGVLLLLAVVSLAWRRPRNLVVRPHVPAFSTPSQPSYVFMALAFLIMATGQVGTVIRDWGTEPFLSEQLPNLIYGLLVVLFVTNAWRDRGVQLRPDGVRQAGVTGWLVIPWDAVPTVPALPPAPHANTVPLTFERPELVRRSGLHVLRRKLQTQDIEPWLLTAAISYYVAHPEHRAAIGSREEYARLRAELHDPFAPWPRTA